MSERQPVQPVFDPVAQARIDANPGVKLYEQWVDSPMGQVDPADASRLLNYLETRPSIDVKGRVHSADGKFQPVSKIDPESPYADQASGSSINRGNSFKNSDGITAGDIGVELPVENNTAYEDMGIPELAKKLGEAERREDRSTATNVSEVLIDKIALLVDRTNMKPDAQEALFERVWRIKDGVDATTNKAKKVQAKAEKAEKVTSTFEWEPIDWPEAADKAVKVPAQAPEKAVIAAEAKGSAKDAQIAEANADVSQAEVSPQDRVKQIEKELAEMADNGASRDDFTAKLFEYRAAYREAVPKDAGLKTLNAYLDNMNDNIKAMTSWFRDGASAPVANEAKVARPVEAPAESGVTPQKRMVELRREIKAHIANGDISPEDYAAKVNEYRESYLLSIPEGESDDSIKKFIKQLDDDTAKIYALYQPQTAGEPVADATSTETTAGAPSSNPHEALRDAHDQLWVAKERFAKAGDDAGERKKAIAAARAATNAVGRLENWDAARTNKENMVFEKRFGEALSRPKSFVSPDGIVPKSSEAAKLTPEQEQEAAYQLETSELRVVIREEFRKEKEARALLGADLSKMNAAELRAFNEKLEALGGDNALLQMEEQRDNFDQKIKDLTEALDIRVKARATELGADEEWIEKEQNTQAKLLSGEEQETDPAKTAAVPVVTEIVPKPKTREKKTQRRRVAAVLGLVAVGVIALFNRGDPANTSQVTTATTKAPEAAAPAAPAPNESPKGLKPGQTIWDKATEQLRSQGISSPSEADIAHEMSHQMYDKSGNPISLEDASKLPVGFENSRK